MKNFFITLLLAILPMTAFAQLPSVTVENVKGEKVNTATIADKKTPAIISFWSVTCKPCITELDAICDVLDYWKEEVNFRVVAISTDDTRFLGKAKALVQGHGWTDFVTLFDKNQEFMRAMNVSVTPQVFVVDKNGKIVYSHTGYTPGSEKELLKVIKKISGK